MLSWLRNFRSYWVIGLFVTGLVHGATLGQDYVLVSPPQPVDNPHKVEVLEVFSYACPHCSSLAPVIEPWARKLPTTRVVYKRIPVSFGRPQWATLARAYYTLEAMGATEGVHEKIFAAVHAQHINLSSEDTLFEWIGQQGLDRQKFINTYRSFAIQSKVRGGDQRAMSYGVDGVPTLIVNGSYRTEPAMVGSNAALLPVLDDLIQLAARNLRK